MWALIRANRYRTVLLVTASLAVMAAVGCGIGGTIPWVAGCFNHPISDRAHAPGFSPLGGLMGIEIAVLVWLAVTIITALQGDRILLAAAGARPLRKDDNPRLYNVLEEMSLAASLPRMPRPYLIDDPSMNAFATGFSPDRAAIAVTAGALARLNRDELQGVAAHETAHIANGDVLFMTIACLMSGAARGGGLFSSAHRVTLERFAARVGGRPDAVSWPHRLLRAFSGLLAMLAPVYAIPVLLGVARRRDFLADACAALYTRYPEGLASALYTMSGDTRSVLQRNTGIATLYTINPYRKEHGIHTPLLLAVTHAPAQQRIDILRSIHSSVSLANYERAWRRETGSKMRLLPSGVDAARAFPIREGAVAAPGTLTGRARDTLDLARKIRQFTFLECVCGMRIKLPPDYPADQILCPRCARMVRRPIPAGSRSAAIPMEGTTGLH